MKSKRKLKKEQMPFPKILSSLLKERKVTIAQAAKACGVSPSTISDWKEGASPEDYLAVKKLAQFFEVSFSFLLTGVNNDSSTKPTISECFEDGGEIFYDGYAQITVRKLIPKK